MAATLIERPDAQSHPPFLSPVVLKRLLQTVLPVLILALPSFYLLRTTPPLWRDIDAYTQVTSAPGISTILLYSPFYCFPARIPLYAGYRWEARQSRKHLLKWAFFSHPILTDSGVFLLLLCQHGMLVSSELYFIRSASDHWFNRICLAGCFALNACFYTFSHTVGSEALSLCCIVLLCSIALRLFRRRRARWTAWVCYGVVLTLAVLVRHINGVLPAILPGALLFAAMAIATRASRRRFTGLKAPRRLLAGQGRRFALATGIGVASLVGASLTERALCAAFHVKRQSIASFAFSWRLNFLTRMTAEEREKLVGDWAREENDPTFRALLETIPSHITGSGQWDVDAYENELHERARASSSTGGAADEKVWEYRGKVFKTIVRSLEPHYCAAIAEDYFHRVWNVAPAAVAKAPYYTTEYYFRHEGIMKKVARLRTYRMPDAHDRIFADAQTPYCGLLNLPYRWMLPLWLALAALGWRLTHNSRLFAFSLSLALSGALLVFLNICLTEFQIRYTLPLWGALFFAILLHMNQCIEGYRLAKISRAHTGTRISNGGIRVKTDVPSSATPKNAPSARQSDPMT